MDGYNRTVDKDETNEEDQINRGLGLPSRNTSSSETPLILAAKNGITEIVEVINS